MIRSLIRRLFSGPARFESVPATPAAQAAVSVDPLRQYAELCRRSGIDRLYFVLSFDCDTPHDAPAAEQIDPWLRHHGIKAAYAVPGVQLEQGAEHYARLAASGACFINHGYLPHTEMRDDGLFHGITFYNEMSEDEVVKDIRRGHAIVEEIAGLAPLGFRAPHFGYYQSQAQREVIYRTARELGYKYCSGTLPEFGVAHGPVVDVGGGLVEIPLSGSRTNPGVILDSWNYYYENRVLRDVYADFMEETVDFYLSNGLPGVLNFYVDPSHVADAPPFFRAMEMLVRRKVVSLDFLELLPFAAPIAPIRASA